MPGKNKHAQRVQQKHANRQPAGPLAHLCSLILLQDWAAKIKAGRLSKGERLGVTNHDEIEYPPFRRNFYIEVSLAQQLSMPLTCCWANGGSAPAAVLHLLQDAGVKIAP